MANKTLADEIITMIQSYSNNNPPPALCKIVKNYPDSKYCDVSSDGIGILKYVKVIGDTTVGLDGIINFIDGNLNNAVVITASKSHESMGEFDVDFNLNFGLSGRDDMITVETIKKKKMEWNSYDY